MKDKMFLARNKKTDEYIKKVEATEVIYTDDISSALLCTKDGWDKIIRFSCILSSNEITLYRKINND